MRARQLGNAVWLLVIVSGMASCGSDSDNGAIESDGGTGGQDDTTESDDTTEQEDPESSVDLGPSCPPLPEPEGRVITVTPDDVAELRQIVESAQTGDTILFADGTYELNGDYLWISTPGVTLRSESGDRDSVILDGNYASTEIITVQASDVTIADLTIRRPYTHAVHVTTSDESDTLNTLIYDVHVVDPREQGIKINPSPAATHFTDRGTVACSLLELTEQGRPNVNPTSGGCYTGGIDAHASREWVVRDNEIRGFFCPGGLSEHAVHFWRGSKDTLVERNILVDNARGVGFGLATEGDARTYSDDECPYAGYVDHYGGLVRNNLVFAASAELFASSSGFDCGICLWSACGAAVVHNTVVSLGDNFSSIEWRFEGSQDVTVSNNLVTHPLRERDGAVAEQAQNLSEAPLDWLVDAENGDLHLAQGASEAIDQGVSLDAGVCDEDIDGDTRDSTPDIGADEVP